MITTVARRAGYGLIAVLVVLGLLARLDEGGVFNYTVVVVIATIAGWFGVRSIVRRRHLAAVARRLPVMLAPPIGGRPDAGDWMVVNSPTDAVPSHGTHAYAQTFALDTLRMDLRPDDSTMAWNEPADSFPSFGMPLCSPVDGIVIAVRDRARDHRARLGGIGYLYIWVESLVRSLTGPGGVMGNRIIVRDNSSGQYVVLAHLKKRSARVARGDWVSIGQHIADCGNSGNSTEPHLHLQVQTRLSPLLGFGVPFQFEIGGQPHVVPSAGGYVALRT